MRKMRKLFPAIVMLVVSAVMMVSSSYAWFSMNTEVTANGMQVTAMSATSLVISDTNSAAVFPGESTTPAGKLSGNATIAPATWGATQWQYSANGADDKGASNGELANVPTGDEAKYFVDYVVYIASAGAALPEGSSGSGKLQVKITWPTKDANVGETYKAVSVAFYVFDSHAIATPLATSEMPALNTQYDVNYNADSYAAALETAKAEWADVASVAAIPSATTGDTKGCIPVLMRVYFDGDLKPAKSDIHYVRSNSVDTTESSISVVFRYVA